MNRITTSITGLLLAAALLLLTGCAQDETAPAAATAEQPAQAPTIALDADIRALDSRAGQPGNIDYSVLTKTGFGVYAYTSTTSKPDFFCNTQARFSTAPLTSDNVTYNLWNYGALQYWPTGGKSLSFYAYAPYVKDPGSTVGITGLAPSSAESTDLPTVTYTVATKPSESVDLLWGVDERSGKPWTAQTARSNDGTVFFTFHHALAALAFHVQAIIDQTNVLKDLADQSGTGLLGTSQCKLTIKRITLAPSNAEKKFYTSGTLSLNNSTPWAPAWTPQPANTPSLQLGNEGGEDIVSTLKDPGPADDEATLDFLDNDAIPGVTETANAQSLISLISDKEQYFMLIPDAATLNYTATIEYYITYATTSAPGYRRLDYTGKNAGKATIEGLALKAGTKYYLNFVIGLTTVDLHVTAADWDDVPLPLDVTIERGTSASESLAPRR